MATRLDSTPVSSPDRNASDMDVQIRERALQPHLPNQQSPQPNNGPPPFDPAKVHRQQLSEFSAITSTSMFPSSPLDDIDPSLWRRFPRFSTATEASQPDLSYDEVTSTRFSVDEEGIIDIFTKPGQEGLPRRHSKIRRGLSRALSNSSTRIKHMSQRLRKVPSNLHPRRSQSDTMAVQPITVCSCTIILIITNVIRTVLHMAPEIERQPLSTRQHPPGVFLISQPRSARTHETQKSPDRK